jgi:hypothetical protein
MPQPLHSRRDAVSAPGSHELALLDRVSRLLAEATTFEAIKSLRDRAEAVRKLAKMGNYCLEVLNRAAELKLRAERKAGEILRSLKLRGGDRRSKGHRVRLNLDDLGISRQDSKRWQCISSLPEEVFRQYIRTANKLGQEISSANVQRMARKARAANGGGQIHRRRKVSNMGGNGKPLDDELDELAESLAASGTTLAASL